MRCILELPPYPHGFDSIRIYEIDIPKMFIQFKKNFSSYSEFEEAFKQFMKDNNLFNDVE